MECTSSFLVLLSEFRCVFTRPSFQIFLCLMTGWFLSPRRRFVTELIWSSGSTHRGHHSRYHNFFSKSVWELDTLSRVLAHLLVAVFAPAGIIALAVDDTLCRKRGLTVYGTGMHHDPLISSRAKPLVRWGHDWVVLTLIVHPLFWAPTKVWSLPIAFRLYHNRQGLTKGKRKAKRPGKAKKSQKPRCDPNHRTRPELAVELISLVAGWFPERQLLVSGDSAYGGASVPTRCSTARGWIGRPAGSCRPTRRGGRSRCTSHTTSFGIVHITSQAAAWVAPTQMPAVGSTRSADSGAGGANGPIPRRPPR